MTKLLLADDHAIVRSGLKQILALMTDFEVVAEACDGITVMDQLRLQPVDLVLMDLNMPGSHGADLIRRVKSHYPNLPILVLSMHDKPHVVAQALKAGANGYITKDCEPAILVAAIHTVAAHGNYVQAAIATRMAFDRGATAQGPAHTLLSDRELAVLRLLTQGQNVKEIGVHLAISASTVSTHKARMMEKLALGTMAELMRYAMANDLL